MWRSLTDLRLATAVAEHVFYRLPMDLVSEGADPAVLDLTVLRRDLSAIAPGAGQSMIALAAGSVPTRRWPRRRDQADRGGPADLARPYRCTVGGSPRSLHGGAMTPPNARNAA
jgi:hypothetical protein